MLKTASPTVRFVELRRSFFGSRHEHESSSSEGDNSEDEYEYYASEPEEHKQKRFAAHRAREAKLAKSASDGFKALLASLPR